MLEFGPDISAQFRWRWIFTKVWQHQYSGRISGDMKPNRRSIKGMRYLVQQGPLPVIMKLQLLQVGWKNPSYPFNLFFRPFIGGFLHMGKQTSTYFTGSGGSKAHRWGLRLSSTCCGPFYLRSEAFVGKIPLKTNGCWTKNRGIFFPQNGWFQGVEPIFVERNRTDVIFPTFFQTLALCRASCEGWQNIQFGYLSYP